MLHLQSGIHMLSGMGESLLNEMMTVQTSTLIVFISDKEELCVHSNMKEVFTAYII